MRPIPEVRYNGALVPPELMSVLAVAAAAHPDGLPGTLTLDGLLAKVERCSEGGVVVIPIDQVPT